MLHFANEEKKRVYYFPSDIEGLIEYFNHNPDATLIINFDKYLDYNNQKDFLKKVNLINYKKVLVNGVGSFDFNLEYLKTNKNLIELDDKYSEVAYDFLNFPNLEVLRYLYIEESSNYSRLTKLQELSLWSYSKKSIDEFLGINNLKDLRFIQSKIQDIDGIGNFKKLEKVFLITNKDLKFDINNQTNENVKELYIDNCKKIEINSIPQLFPNLQKLAIINNGEIKELKYILEKLKNLRELNLMKTKILESDNRYWKDYTNIESIQFLDYKHLVLKSDDFKIKNVFE